MSEPSQSDSEKPISLLLESEPWYRGFLRRIKETLRPAKLPPLELTSQPVPVTDLWSRSRFNRAATPLSALVHGLLVAILLMPVGREVVQVSKKKEILYAPITLSSYQISLPPAADKAGGGGGGGARSKEPASRGKLPELAMVQKAPPVVIIRNPEPKLPVEPSIVVPPEIPLLTTVNLAMLGDPLSLATVPSNGPGSGSGIGDGDKGGVGPGKGPGAGPGEGGGCCGGRFSRGGSVSAPEVVFQVEPEYSEQARKSKYQGTVVIRLTVNSDGTSSDIEVITPLGMGLDEKAVEAVRQWRFRPAQRGKEPVAVSALIEVTFRLL